MQRTRRFNNDLLESPWIEKLNSYRTKKVPHAKLIDVTDQIRRSIILRGSEGFIFIVGPTRIGKTTICRSITGTILKAHLEEMRSDPGFVPIAGMEATAYSTKYNWRDHWVGCLESLKEPLIDKKIDYDRPYGRPPKLTELAMKTEKEATLRRAFENCANHRKLKVFTIDEAQHLTLVPSARLYRSQIEIIKSVASKSGAMHLLFGTYDLLKLRNSSGQLGTRAVTVHFARYRAIPDDLTAFAQAVHSLVGLMPFQEPPDLVNDSTLEYIFETSLGCIGIVKVWFVDALGAALEASKKTLSIKDLERYAPPIDVREKISKEILDGERLLEEDPRKLQVIRLRLNQPTGLSGKKHPSRRVKQLPPSDELEQDSLPNKPAAVPPRKRRPGERLPQRDPVGTSRARLLKN